MSKQHDNLVLSVSGAAAAAATMTAISLYYVIHIPEQERQDATVLLPQRPLSLPQKVKTYMISKLKSWIIASSGLDKKVIVLLPEGDYNATEKTNSSRGKPESNKSYYTYLGGKEIMQPLQEQKKHTLLVLFPGVNVDGSEYVEIGRKVQKMAAKENLPVVVGIGISLQSRTRLLKWALTPTVVADMVQDKAGRLLVQNQNQKGGSSSSSVDPSDMFPDLFIWGHSWGGFEAMKAALPTRTNGLILYGCSMSLYQTLISRPWPDLLQNNMLSSYPRPVLTIMGERDGFLRWPAIAGEAHTLHKDSQRRIKSSSPAAPQLSIQNELQKADELRKPVVILSGLNHMQMAMGKVPAMTAKTGRSDFESPIDSLGRAHEALARVVVDFLHVHSTTCITEEEEGTTMYSIKSFSSRNGMIHNSNNSNSNSSSSRIRTQVEKRLQKQHSMTESLFLGPYSRLSDRVFVSQFMGQLQRKLLHITSNFEKFHFYDESDTNDEDQQHHHDTFSTLEKNFPSDKEPFTIVTNWHQEHEDFVYSKARWSLKSNHLWLEATEQSPISYAPPASPHIRFSQISNTLAFKGKCQEHILRDNPKFQAIKDGPAPTLMQLNKITFDEVLHNVVTPQQRQRYKKFGTELRFGPDILVWPPPLWVDTPISLTRYAPPDDEVAAAAAHHDNNNNTKKRRHTHNDQGNATKAASSSTNGEKSYYLLQSPYVTTAHLDYLPPPFAGAWYGKPLSPAQAYEWIVFDAFKS